MTNISPAEGAPVAHLTRITHHRISHDDAWAEVAFEDQDGKPFVLRVSVEALDNLRQLLHTMWHERMRRAMPGWQVRFQYPASVAVAYANGEPGVVVLQFDERMPTEVNYKVPVMVALDFAEGIEKNALSQLTEKQRHEWARKKHPLLLPQKGTVILPPGV